MMRTDVYSERQGCVQIFVQILTSVQTVTVAASRCVSTHLAHTRVSVHQATNPQLLMSPSALVRQPSNQNAR